MNLQLTKDGEIVGIFDVADNYPLPFPGDCISYYGVIYEVKRRCFFPKEYVVMLKVIEYIEEPTNAEDQVDEG